MHDGTEAKPTPVAAFNSVRHGLRARTIVIPGLEDPADWVRFRDGVVASLTPEGELETELAVCVAECAWRRRRVARHESQLVDVERQRENASNDWQERKKELLEPAGEDSATPSRPKDEVLRQVARDFYGDLRVSRAIDATYRPEHIFPPKDELDRLIRYEAHITRQQYHALHELQALQARRRGEPAPLARLSVLGS
jgi:hypothetical protein